MDSGQSSTSAAEEHLPPLLPCVIKRVIKRRFSRDSERQRAASAASRWDKWF